MELYPLKFNPIFKEKIWGGQKIKTILGKDFGPLPNCGETWEISGVKGNVSQVSEGGLKGCGLDTLIEEYKGKLVGERIYKEFGNEFPLLVKFIDANEDLSIQVHPDDKVAKAKHSCFGKTEMWYVFQAEEGARLNTGFQKGVTKEKYLEYLENNKLEEVLNFEEVKSGDVFFLPAGRVHFIGKGILLAEIQQTSDITYRIYDFDRVDDKGQKRELHTELALDVIDFNHYSDYKTQYTDKVNTPVQLVQNVCFTTNLLHVNGTISRSYKGLDCFVIYVCFEGKADIKYGKESINIQKGDSVLIPATIEEVTVESISETKLLESYID